MLHPPCNCESAILSRSVCVCRPGEVDVRVECQSCGAYAAETLAIPGVTIESYLDGNDQPPVAEAACEVLIDTEIGEA